MATVIESEEEIACLVREIEEEQDQLESTIAWFLSQNYLKSTIKKIVAVGDIALLRTMESDSQASKDNLLVAASLSLCQANNSENLVKARNQITANAKELDRWFTQMRSGDLEKELDKCHHANRELRSKKHAMQYELNAKKQRVDTEELEISGFMDVLKEIKRDNETTIHSYEQELQKVENILNDENYVSPLFPDLCE
uniref:Uncharacterized protein n=1 Tax=Anopheles epiroticus TaxID=199890 RepID=A0A182PVY3_9DIPT